MKMPPAQTSPIPTQPEQNSRNTWQHRLGQSEAVKLLALVAVFTLPALLFLRNFFMSDPDFGWHLSAGQWIFSHHAVPFTDPFSTYGAGKPWYDYSWLFDI